MTSHAAAVVVDSDLAACGDLGGTVSLPASGGRHRVGLIGQLGSRSVR